MRGGRSFGGGGRGAPGGRGGFGAGRGRGRSDEGPPAEVTELGSFLHDAEGEMVCRLTNAMIPYFNAGVYLENKTKIGKVEEVFGPINRVYFSIKPDSGVLATSFKANDVVYIGTDKLLPMSRFTNEKKSGGGRGAGRGAPGGRGGPGGRFGGRGPAGRGPSTGFSRGGGRGGGRGPPARGGFRGSPFGRGRG